MSNWLLKSAKPISNLNWELEIHKVVQLMIPGYWKLKLKESAYIGYEQDEMVLISNNPMNKNAKFVVFITRHFDRNESVPTLPHTIDSEIGHSNIHFSCKVFAGKLYWDKKIAEEEYLDTPYEVGQLVRSAVEGYRDDEGGEEEVTPDTPIEPTRVAPRVPVMV